MEQNDLNINDPLATKHLSLNESFPHWMMSSSATKHSCSGNSLAHEKPKYLFSKACTAVSLRAIGDPVRDISIVIRIWGSREWNHNATTLFLSLDVSITLRRNPMDPSKHRSTIGICRWRRWNVDRRNDFWNFRGNQNNLSGTEFGRILYKTQEKRTSSLFDQLDDKFK